MSKQAINIQNIHDLGESGVSSIPIMAGFVFLGIMITSSMGFVKNKNTFHTMTKNKIIAQNLVKFYQSAIDTSSAATMSTCTATSTGIQQPRFPNGSDVTFNEHKNKYTNNFDVNVACIGGNLVLHIKKNSKSVKLTPNNDTPLYPSAGGGDHGHR